LNFDKTKANRMNLSRASQTEGKVSINTGQEKLSSQALGTSFCTDSVLKEEIISLRQSISSQFSPEADVS
jgi:hypothetical protein